MKKRVAALAIALGCLIGFVIVFTETTGIDPLLRRTALRAAPPQLKARLRPWRAPLVTSSSPEQGRSDVLPRSPITLTFLTAMNPSTVERNISFAPRVPGQFSWQDERTMVFSPAQPWPADTRITVEVNRGARSWLLRRMEEPFSLYFTILASPIVVNTEPSQRVQFAYDLDQAVITFSHLMDETSVESRLTVEPQIHDLELAWAEETLTITGDFRVGITYQVTLTKGAQEATYGLPMAKGFAWAFTVVERRPDLAVDGPGRVGMVEAETPFELPFTILNLSRIDLALYALDGPTFTALQGLSAKDWEQYHSEGNPIREWSALSEARADREMSQKVEVDPLPPGLYFLAVDSPEGARAGQLLSVSRSALVLKRAPEQILVWVVALADGSPAADYEVTIYAEDGQVLAAGRTDREGVFKSSLPREAEPLLAIAQREGDVAVCAEEWSAVAFETVEGLSGPADTMTSGDRVYAYTDRPLYHPGQGVHFRAIVRRDDDGRHSLLPTDTRVPIVVTDEAGRTVYQDTLQLTPFGSISGSFPLSEEATAGGYRLVVSVGGNEHGSYFQVERPRRPGYAVSVTTDRSSYVKGDVITATVSASYDFEVPVAGVEVSYTLYAASYLPLLPGDDFDFGWTGQEDAEGEKRAVMSGQGVTDDAGRFIVALPTDAESLSSSQFCTLEVTVTAPSQQPVSASTSFPVHQSSLHIGLRPERRVARAGQEVAFDVQTVDTEGLVLSPALSQAEGKVEGQPWGRVRLRYTLDLVEWHRAGDGGGWEEQSTEVTRGSLRTDGQGQAQIAFKPATAGTYRLRIEGEDRRGNRIANSAQLWVSEAGREGGWRWPEGDQLELITDKQRYRAGEVAEVMVLSPYRRATALLTVERGRVMAYRAVKLEGYSDIVSVPVESEYFPNAFVSVVLIPGHHSAGEPSDVNLTRWRSSRTSSAPARRETSPVLSVAEGFATPEENSYNSIKIGYTELTIESAEKELVISLSPDKERYQPGERVVYHVRTADGEGQPVSAEVSLAVVDAASSGTLGIVEAFHGWRGLAVRTANSLAVHLGREGSAWYFENPATSEAFSPLRGALMVRQSFDLAQENAHHDGLSKGWPTAFPLSAPSAPPRFRAEVIYWNPTVVTNEDGQARYPFVSPTSW